MVVESVVESLLPRKTLSYDSRVSDKNNVCRLFLRPEHFHSWCILGERRTSKNTVAMDHVTSV